MKQKNITDLKSEIQLQAKNGIDFILAAGIVWLLISYIWTLGYSSYQKSIFTFMIGSILLPLAFGLSKIIKTNWKVKDNPLQPLGLWLNFAQLIYFPFLIFTLIKHPDYFIMAYAIITGAHLFPYAWFYDEIGYAAWAILISVGTLLLTLNIATEKMWTIPLFTSIMLFLLTIWIYIRITNKNKKKV
ncbi:hypothetical protein FIA58_018070 [Flavobacterium jejuense]|uniref:Uncharacterized protein n=1 Tax=Flavobacterium jejuense TaxID=1544455 RepID=A0ABX0IVI9_9FLAO|nr:hypothetical protein [Flavobacterium jejuense]NHN27591.1 hypothetical protein [Flavobacterium jejuense]